MVKAYRTAQEDSQKDLVMKAEQATRDMLNAKSNLRVAIMNKVMPEIDRAYIELGNATTAFICAHKKVADCVKKVYNQSESYRKNLQILKKQHEELWTNYKIKEEELTRVICEKPRESSPERTGKPVIKAKAKSKSGFAQRSMAKLYAKSAFKVADPDEL